jgi:hypothetical protein
MMHKTMIKMLAFGAATAALLMPAPRAEAAAMRGTIGAAAEQINPVEQARTVRVCQRYWNGYRWRTRCRYVTVAPRPYYYYNPFWPFYR